MTSSLRPDHPTGGPPSKLDQDRSTQSLADAAQIRASVKIVANGVNWRVRPGWEWLVYAQTAPDWLKLVAEPQAEPVKRNSAREVWRVIVDGQEFYCKLYRHIGLKGVVRTLIRGSGCTLEWRAGEHGRKHRVATVEPVAYGTVGWRGTSGPGILITRGLAGALPLYAYWEREVLSAGPSERRRRANAILEATAAAVARAHQFGFHHRDLHSGNLLAVPDGDGRPRVVFVDLHNVRASRRVRDGHAIRNLAQLNQWYRQRATRSDRLRFLRHYVAFRDELARRAGAGLNIQMDTRTLLEALGRAIDRHARGLWAKRDRVAMRDGKYFCRLKTRTGWRGHVYLRAKHPDTDSRASRIRLSRTQWREWLDNPLDLIRRDRTGLIKDSHSAYVCRAQLPTSDGPLEVVVKRSRWRTWLKRCAGLVWDSRNLRSWKRGYQLLNRGLPTARPLAVVERRAAGLLLDSICLTEAIPDSKDFDAMLRMDLPKQDRDRLRGLKDQLIRVLVRLVKDLHAKGFAHRDLKAANILIQWDLDGNDPPRLTLIDLDGLSLCRRLSWAERLRPLMRLNVSLDDVKIVTRTDRLRFLKAFLIDPGRSDAGWKDVWRELAGRSDRKRTHKEKRRQWKLDHYGRT